MAHLSHVSGTKKEAGFSEVQFAIGRHFYFPKFALPSNTQVRGLCFPFFVIAEEFGESGKLKY